MRISKVTLVANLPLIAMVLSAVAAEPQFDKNEFLKEGFVPLFNGKNLTGWKVPEGDNGHWKVVDGVIDYDAQSEAPKDKNLWTEESFGDFALHIEWRLKQTSGLYPMQTILPDGSAKTDADGKVITTLLPNADSGIFLRGSGKAQINIWCWPIGSGELWGYRNDKTMPPEVRAAAVPKVHADNPVGQWNAFDITMKGDRLTILLNGKTVIDNARLPGIPTSGPIALQHHGGINKKTGELNPASSLIQFRNIYLKRLDASAAKPAKGVSMFTLLPDEHGRVLKTPDGRTVFRYMTRKPADSALTANSLCCLYPLNTPSGERVVDFAPSDHRHHRGVFLAWHSMTAKVKADFWGWGAWAPTAGRVIENRSVELVEADSTHAQLNVRNEWLADGEVVVVERLTILAREQERAYVIDMTFQLTPTSDVTLDQTAFGGFCVKGRKDGKGLYVSLKGEVKLPDPHHLKPESDWPAADWYDYTIALDNNKTVGVAVLDHPDNPPSLWHNLAPIAMVNPCIVAPGPVTLKKDQTLTLRYRLVVHDGPTPTDLLKRLSAEWRRR